MPLSAKSQRLLKQLGVCGAFERGEELALVGPTYELRKRPGIHARLAFRHADDGQLCIGYATDESGAWVCVESEAFSRRGLGYYQRRLKRIGDRLDPKNSGRMR